MGDEQDGGTDLVPQLANEIEDLGLHRGVEAGGRLVEHEQQRIGGERHGDDDALQHAAGELVRVAIEHADRIGDVHALKCSASQVLGLRLRVAEHLVGLRHLAADLQDRIHGLDGVLIHHRGVVRAELTELFR